MAQSKITSRRGENFSNYQSQETESNRLANQPIPTEVPLPVHCRNDYLSTRKRMPGEEEEGESIGDPDPIDANDLIFQENGDGGHYSYHTFSLNAGQNYGGVGSIDIHSNHHMSFEAKQMMQKQNEQQSQRKQLSLQISSNQFKKIPAGSSPAFKQSQLKQFQMRLDSQRRHKSCENQAVPQRINRIPLRQTDTSTLQTSTEGHLSISQAPSHYLSMVSQQMQPSQSTYNTYGRSRNATGIGHSFTSTGMMMAPDLARPQSRQLNLNHKLQFFYPSHQLQTREHNLSAGNPNFIPQMLRRKSALGTRKIHHNPYESFPTTMLVKTSNQGSDYNLGATSCLIDENDIITQMQEQDESMTDLTTKTQSRTFSNINNQQPVQYMSGGGNKMPARSRNYMVGLPEKCATDLDLSKLIQQQKERVLPQQKRIKVNKMQKLFLQTTNCSTTGTDIAKNQVQSRQESTQQTNHQESTNSFEKDTRKYRQYYKSQQPLFRQVDRVEIPDSQRGRQRNSSLAGMFCCYNTGKNQGTGGEMCLIF